MKTTEQVSHKYKLVCTEIDDVSAYMREYEYGESDLYISPQTDSPIPGADDTYTFGKRLSYLIGQKYALMYVLNIN